jgi:hypothetical protein
MALRFWEELFCWLEKGTTSSLKLLQKTRKAEKEEDPSNMMIVVRDK